MDINPKTIAFWPQQRQLHSSTRGLEGLACIWVSEYGRGGVWVWKDTRLTGSEAMSEFGNIGLGSDRMWMWMEMGVHGRGREGIRG